LRSALAAAALVAALAGCGGGSDENYTKESVDRFVKACSKPADSSEAACRCVIERLQVTMPYDEFVAYDDALRNNRKPRASSVAKLRAAADRCR
jgi:hypothetical protein